MKTIFITISRGALIRNFFQTKVIDHLTKHVRVVVLTPYVNHPVFKNYKHPNLIFEPLTLSTHRRFQSLFTELEKAAVFNKTVQIRYKYRVTGRDPSQFLYVLRIVFANILSFIPWLREIIRFFDFYINPEKENDYLFEKYKPNLVFNTAAGDNSMLKGAGRFGIKTVDMPKSWDVLSKRLFSFKAKHLLVWNVFMKEQAIKFHGYKDNEIIVTGIPQFDFYLQKKRLLTREEFCRKFNLNPSKKIILYGSTGGNCCFEEDYIKLLNNYIEKKKIPNTQILIRPHIGYKDDLERFYFARKLPSIVLDESGKRDETFRDGWDTSEEYVDTLFNSLHHADVSINIASTLTLDAIACDTPVININFDIRENLSPHWSTKRLFLSDYIQEIVKQDATWVCESEKAFLSTLKHLLSDPSVKYDKKEGQKDIVDRLMYKLDGRSNERITRALISLAGK